MTETFREYLSSEALCIGCYPKTWVQVLHNSNLQVPVFFVCGGCYPVEIKGKDPCPMCWAHRKEYQGDRKSFLTRHGLSLGSMGAAGKFWADRYRQRFPNINRVSSKK